MYAPDSSQHKCYVTLMFVCDLLSQVWIFIMKYGYTICFSCVVDSTITCLYCRYYSLSEIADHFFPPRERLGVYDNHFSTVKYWKDPLPPVTETEILEIDKDDPAAKWQPPSADKQSVSVPVDPTLSRSDSILQSDNSYDLLDMFSESETEEDIRLTQALEPRQEFQKTGKYWLMPFSFYM